MSESKKKMPKSEKKAENEIFIGNKPFMKYVIAAIMQLKDGSDITVIKARGKFIARAVDVAEVTKKKFKEANKISLKDSIKINTEEFKSEEGKNINISTIEIGLSKQ